KLRQDLQFYLDKIPCKEVTSLHDSIVLEILGADAQSEADITAKEIGWFRRKVIAFRVVLKARRMRKEKLRHASKM
ncbi:hypothetical protein Godav_005271, partial [Gossypium davidsonii]|nr:hypothetical protein [Gossypium davidsonii]